MDALLSDCRLIPPGHKTADLPAPWRQALALPQDARLYLLEITKFLGTLALIVAGGFILLMAG